MMSYYKQGDDPGVVGPLRFTEKDGKVFVGWWPERVEISEAFLLAAKDVVGIEGDLVTLRAANGSAVYRRLHLTHGDAYLYQRVSYRFEATGG